MFKPNILVTPNGVMVAIKLIESIGAVRDADDLVVDRLQGDIVFSIRTVSGKEYLLSTKYQMEIFEKLGISGNLIETHRSILEKWGQLIGNYGNFP